MMWYKTSRKETSVSGRGSRVYTSFIPGVSLASILDKLRPQRVCVFAFIQSSYRCVYKTDSGISDAWYCDHRPWNSLGLKNWNGHYY